jgi:hypothetical protein
MKLLAAITLLAAGVSALAAPDTEQLDKRACAKNNCIRAMIARPDAATTFCQAYTTTSSAGVGQFTQCDSPSKASAACSCVVPVSLAPSKSCPFAVC